MFFFKKLISAFLLPTSIIVALLVAGVLLLWLGRRQRLGRGLVTVGTALLALASFSPLSHAFLSVLENRYPPLYPRAALEQATRNAGKPPRWIVVLGAGHIADPRVAANDQIGDSALFRLVEAVRLQRELPGTRILLSGGGPGPIKHADVLGQVAVMLGVPPEGFVLDRSAWDTEQEAVNLSGLIGQDPFLLVTSAVHLPRAVALFRRLGLHPIPAPANHQALDAPGVDLRELIPSPRALTQVEMGMHEYLGILWSRLRGRI